LHAPLTDHMCGWLDQQLFSSYFISTPAVSSTATMVGRPVPLKSQFSPTSLLSFDLYSYFFIFFTMSC
jgi:hypothetical protein